MIWTEKSIATAKGMLARGDRQMDIAVWFGVNQARINEIAKGKSTFGKRWKHVVAADPVDLPAPGPYKIVARMVYDDSIAKAKAYDDLVKSLKLWLSEHSPVYTENVSETDV